MSKRAILTTIIVPILLISGLIIFLINNRQEPAAELVLTQQQIHFETLPEWEGPVTRSLTARNAGEHPLHIQRVHTGCSYAEITGPEVIQPGYGRHVPDSHQPRTSARRRDFGNRDHLHRQSQDPDCPPNNYCHSETICDPHA